MQVQRNGNNKRLTTISTPCTHKHLWSAYCIDSKHVICRNSMLRLLTQKPNLYCSNKLNLRINKINNTEMVKKIFSIAAIAIFAASAAIFTSCNKEENKQSSGIENGITTKSSTSSEICLGYFANGVMTYNFNVDELSANIEPIFYETYNENIVLENMIILDSMPLNPNWKPELQATLFSITTEKGATGWYYITKNISDNGVVSYYLTEKQAGGNQPNFICSQGNCKGTCVRNAKYDDNNNITAAWCSCEGDSDTTHHCEQIGATGGVKKESVTSALESLSKIIAPFF